MPRIECSHESDVLLMISTGRWPDRAPVELREHAASCEVCQELAVAAVAMDEVSLEHVPALPSSGTVWWRAQLRARQEAARDVVRPITAAHALAFAALVGVVGAVFGATTLWFQRGLRTVGQNLYTFVANLPLPGLPESLSTPGSWVILLLVAFGLVAGAGVVSWAMKEE
jgi:hypothetical protein